MSCFNKFVKLIEDQFMYGGKKYALEERRESTDVIFDIFGANWLYGTISKYCFRWKNLQREKDILKIACYSYILWLKRGFFIDDKRQVPIDTNIKIKEIFFEDFIKKVKNFIETNQILENFEKSEETLIDSIFDMLKRFSQLKWNEVTENYLLYIFSWAYLIWRKNYCAKETHDTDTWLENE